MSKKELVKGFSTYITMIEGAKGEDLDKKDLNRRTMWGVMFFLVMYSIATTAMLLLKVVEYFLY